MIELNLIFEGKRNAEKVVGLLAAVYPAMFRYEEAAQDRTFSSIGYGLGGLKGLKNLSTTICQRVGPKSKQQYSDSSHFLVPRQVPQIQKSYG